MKQNNKNVLYLSYDGLTDSLGQSQILPYLIGLQKKGYNISIISFEKEANYLQNEEHIRMLCDKNKLDWYPLFYTKKPPVLSTLKDINTLKKLAKGIHKAKNFSIIHARSYITALVALKFKKRYGVKFLFDMRGFWADERIEGGIWSLKKPIYKFIYNYFKRKEKTFFEQSDHIISLTKNGKDEILKQFSAVSKEKITVIPCCVDTELFDPETIRPHQIEKLKSALKITPSDKIIGYVGSIGTWYMLEEMLLFFKKQHDSNKNLKFLFVTKEPFEEIKSVARKIDLELSSLIYASTSYRYVPLHIKLMDWGIFFIRPTFSKKASSPTKQGEIMAMGVPVICNSGVGDTDYIVNKYQAGIIFENFEQEVDLEQPSNPKAIREGAIEFFGLENGVERYGEVYKGLVGV